MHDIVKGLDSIANMLEKKGYIKEAYELDLISNTIDSNVPTNQSDVTVQKALAYLRNNTEEVKALAREISPSVSAGTDLSAGIKGFVEKHPIITFAALALALLADAAVGEYYSQTYLPERTIKTLDRMQNDPEYAKQMSGKITDKEIKAAAWKLYRDSKKEMPRF
jgi:hypothetical protein